MAQDPSKDRLKSLSPSPRLILRPNTHEHNVARPLIVAKGKQRRRTSQKTVTPTLLELPFEIRRRILQFLLSTEIEENYWASYEHNWIISQDEQLIEPRRLWTFVHMSEDFLPAHSVFMEGYTLYPNILWTCKQLLGEGTKMLVEDNAYIAIRYPAAYAPLITAFMMQSGIGTFWVEPGVFKSPTTEHGRPVVAIEVVSVDSRDHATSIRVIVPLSSLGSLCQALSGLKAWITRKSRTAARALRVNLDVCLSSAPVWKKEGFIWTVDYVKRNVLDWIGDSVDQITFSGPKTGLKLENNVRSWLQRQSNTFSIRRSPQDYEKNMHRLVRRFRKAEKEFLSNYFITAFASFMELNAMIECSFPAFLLENDAWIVHFIELSGWIHFYLGMSLLEGACRAEDTHVYDHDKHYCKLKSAWSYLPIVRAFAKWNKLTPGHKVASHFAKAEIACVIEGQEEAPSRWQTHMKRALTVIERESTSADHDKMREMCGAQASQ